MGIIFRKFCSNCDRDAETDVPIDSSAGATTANSRSGGEVIGGGHVAFIEEAGSLIPLQHPGESQRLRALGTSLSNAALQGRLIYVVNMICSDCGSQTTSAKLSTGSAGCGAALVSAFIVAACALFLFNLHPVIEALLIFAALIVPSVLIDQYLLFRFRKNVVPYQNHSCTKCGGRRILPLGSARNRPLPCPRCHQKTLTIVVGGRT